MFGIVDVHARGSQSLWAICLMLCEISFLCGNCVRDGIADVCSSDDGQSDVHGRMSACRLCSEMACREFEEYTAPLPDS